MDQLIRLNYGGKECYENRCLRDFVACYNSKDRHGRIETERFKCFNYEDILKRDKTNLDIFWLKDESLDDLDKLPEPDIIAREIAEDLENALEQLEKIMNSSNSQI